MVEIEKLQALFICCAATTAGLAIFGGYKIIQGHRHFEATTSIIGYYILMYSMPLFAITMTIYTIKQGVQEIQKIEDTLQTGNLYYNDKEISTDSMSPEQIYSDFSYTIAEDGVYVYTK